MYLEIDEGYPGHRKTLRLCALLKSDTADAYPPRLWAWAMRAAVTGDLTGMEPAEIEIAMRYRGRSGALYAAMVAAGFIDEIDGRIEIHDWMERTGAALARMAASAEATKERKRRWTDRQEERRRNGEGTRSNGVPERPENGDEGVPGTPQNGPRQDKASPGKSSPAKASLRSEGSEADCGEPGGPVSPPPLALLTFPCSGTPREWGLTAAQVGAWMPLYPAVDVMAECRKALGWIGANPTRRKTAGGMPRFLVGWLGKCQDRGGVSPLPRPAGRPSREEQNLSVANELLNREAS